MRMPPRRMWIWFAIALVINYAVTRLLLPGPDAPILVPYTLLKQEVAKHNVQSIFSRGETLTGRFAVAITYPPPGAAPAPKDAPAKSPAAVARRGPPRTSQSFVTTLPSFVDKGLEQFLVDNGVEISAEPIDEGGSPWATLLFGFGPALLLIAFYVWLYRRTAQGGGLGGALGIGKSRARRYDQENDSRVTFDDVAGIDEAESELVEIVEFLRDPPKYTRLGGTAPKGVL